MASFPLAASATNFKSGSALTNAVSPFRRMGWSSTVRIRIRLGTLYTALHLSNQFGWKALTVAFVSDGGRNEQLNFGALSGLAPQVQMRPNPVGTFTGASQSPMADSSALF